MASDEDAPQGQPNELVIGTKDNILVRIQPDGTLTYGPNYTPDAAAKEFWEAMAKRRKDYEERLLFLAQIEGTLSRLGEQDLRTEKLRIAAASEKATPHERFQAERAMDQLNVIFHEVIELSRGVALRDRASHNAVAVNAPKRVLH